MKVLVSCIKKGIVFVIVFLAQLQVMAQKPDSLLYRQLPHYPFVFILDPAVVTPPHISDSLFDMVARGIRFQVNRTELQKNDPFISLFNDSLVPILKKKNLSLREIYIKGAASPEGPYLNNVRLSRERTARLIEFLNTHLDQPVSNYPLNAKSVTEDYAYLVKLMEQAGDAEYEQVKAIWEKSKGNEQQCKRELMALNGGRTWKRLLDIYYPTLRQSRVVLWFANNTPYLPLPQYPIIAPYTPQDNPSLSHFISTPEHTTYVRRHLIAVRTNLLHDFLYVPQFGFAPSGNIQLEYYPLCGHYTFNAGFTFSNHRHWQDHQFFQMRDVQLELRRYFKGGGIFLGTYLGAYLEGTKYGIGFSDTKGWQGEGGGAGISVGHTCRLTKKGDLRLELSLSVGAFLTLYDPYVYGNPISKTTDGRYYYNYLGSTSQFKERNHRFTWIGPTNAGIHLTYDIIYRKKKEVKP